MPHGPTWTHRCPQLLLAAILLLSSPPAGAAPACPEVYKAHEPDIEWSDHFGDPVVLDGDTLVVGARSDGPTPQKPGAVYVYTRDGADWMLEAELVPKDGEPGDWFGVALALDGSLLAVGAGLDDGVSQDSGSVYLFERQASGWEEIENVTAGDGAAFDRFGYAVALQGDTLVVGAKDDDDRGLGSGSVYVYRRNGSGEWKQEAKLTASDGKPGAGFGWSVSLDADRIAVGALLDHVAGAQSGSVYVFRRVGSDWSEEAKLVPLPGGHQDRFGISVSLSGDTVAVGSFDDDEFGSGAGAAFVFVRDASGSWTRQAKLRPDDIADGDRFGFSVSLDGERLLAGAPYDGDTGPLSGSAYLFERTAGAWSQAGKLLASDGVGGAVLGISVWQEGATSVAGSTMGASNASRPGGAYVYQCLAQSPVCDAGGPYEVDCDSATPCGPVPVVTWEVFLDGSGSYDPDGGDLDYSWSLSCGSLGFFGPQEATGMSCIPVSCDQPCIGVLAVQDDEGNREVCTSDITLLDERDPELTLPPDASLECDEPTGPGRTGMATASDTCSGDLDPVFEDRTVAGACPYEYSILRTWSAEDACGNSASGEQKIDVRDTTAPELSLPPDLTVECDRPRTPDATGWATATDNCDGAVTPGWSDNVVPGRCPGEFTILRTWSAEDACGNTASATQTITVVDTTPPVIEGGGEDLHCLWPPDHKMTCFGPGAFEPEISDNCSEPVRWLFSACRSDQPDNGLGDGNTEQDCVVEPDRICVRAERAGPDPDGRRYAVEIAAEDACGNRSDAVGIGNIYVPHDQDPRENFCRR